MLVLSLVQSTSGTLVKWMWSFQFLKALLERTLNLLIFIEITRIIEDICNNATDLRKSVSKRILFPLASDKMIISGGIPLPLTTMSSYCIWIEISRTSKSRAFIDYSLLCRVCVLGYIYIYVVVVSSLDYLNVECRRRFSLLVLGTSKIWFLMWIFLSSVTEIFSYASKFSTYSSGWFYSAPSVDKMFLTILRTYINVRLMFKSPQVVVMSHKPLYNGMDVFSYIGGLMGCWLGFSVWTFTGITERTFASVLYYLKQFTKKSHHCPRARNQLLFRRNHHSTQVLSEIKENGILVPDLCNSVNEIDMLLGADVISVILSGRTIKLKSGLIVIGTMLGFTLMGKTSQIVNDNNEISVPTTRERQLNLSDFAKFQRRVKFRAKLLKDLRGRFRKEYLGLLVQKAHKTSRAFKVGEIVLIENPNKKRLYWPLGKVVELIPGRDGKVRTLKLRCNKTEIIRPIQRVFTLEIQSAETAELDVVPLDADAPKIPSANVDVSESTMIPVDAPPNKPKLSS
ncbi:uncharacterized protein NPIL_40751 [Nephila pilipes]|uniref:DUF5641 domain-containing protein n=1 Tax=Nephila pilipes TaxID=299642 RepID=A0A8X6NCI4_NEPPI|nr:uncharacterized protein NPIL_40751 [Nephila pilipes]